MKPVKYIEKQYMEIINDPVPGISAIPNSDNIFKWEAVIIGPDGTPYEKGIFHLDIEFPQDFPFHPPRIIFKTRVYHPNISSDGKISLDILQDWWTPSLMISKILLSICSFLDDPNPDDPLVPEIANQYKDDREAYNRTAREWTEKYAK
ncbi:Ubiquitin-conjugating enzyme E2 4 [Tritrichomonas musculus]|uniref:Ubiquitin-conjugating enzyme E2 4 n=1 Tax=Tritrichomonas musculus TaxID=1915356 RepID=A0ABR2J276_9EUKA